MATTATVNPVKVLFVSNMLDRGGAERVTSVLLQHLDRTVIRPSLCLMRDQIGYPLPEDVPLHCLGYRGLWSFWLSAHRLRVVIESQRPDIVVGNVNATNLLVGFALRGCRHPTIWIARVGNSPRHNDRWIRRIAARLVYPRVDLFAVNSRGLAEGMRTCYPFSADRIEVVRNPTDFRAIDRDARATPVFKRVGNEPLLIAVGRLSRQKRVDLMLEALSRVRVQVSTTLWICGDGPDRQQLVRRAKRLGVASAVRWFGHCANPFALMSQADLFLMSSDYEGLPNSLIESQGLGLPGVSTDCPYGSDEIIEDGVTGVLIPVGDATALAEAILGLLSDSATLERMGTSARKRARETFAVELVTGQWEDILVRAVTCNRETLGLSAKNSP